MQQAFLHFPQVWMATETLEQLFPYCCYNILLAGNDPNPMHSYPRAPLGLDKYEHDFRSQKP